MFTVNDEAPGEMETFINICPLESEQVCVVHLAVHNIIL